MDRKSNFMQAYGYDLVLGSIAAFYVLMAPYTKVEESFSVQAMHDILYHRHHINKYDHLDFPGVVPRTFIGALIVSFLSSPFVVAASTVQLPKIYSLYAVRMMLGCLLLLTLRFFRIKIRKIFGSQVEAFFVILTALQFHMLFYCTRPLPNILAFALAFLSLLLWIPLCGWMFVNLSYGFWFKQSYYAALNCLVFATIVFRCDILLLISPLGLQLLLPQISPNLAFQLGFCTIFDTRSISLPKAFISCLIMALLSIGLTVLIDSFFWRKWLWPELDVFWFNSVLNRSSEWGTHPFHWYFTSALPRSLLAAYPLFMLGVLLERRVLFYVIPVFSFVLLYSKLPHKELRFIISSLPMFNFSAAVAASRIYNNRKKSMWKFLYVAMLGSFVMSLGCTVLTFMASYENYPSGYAMEALHKIGHDTNDSNEMWVHIDTYSAMNGISRFCENDPTWRYSKEEGIPPQEFQTRNFTYLLSEYSQIDGYECLLSVKGFSAARLRVGFPPISLVKTPKVFVHGNMKHGKILRTSWPGC